MDSRNDIKFRADHGTILQNSLLSQNAITQSFLNPYSHPSGTCSCGLLLVNKMPHTQVIKLVSFVHCFQANFNQGLTFKKILQNMTANGKQIIICKLFIVFKWAIAGLFLMIIVFSNKHFNFYNKYMWKMSILYIVMGLFANCLLFLNGPSPGSFWWLSSFQTNIIIFTTNTCEKWPSCI